jgi:hypothetical protein
MILTDKLKAALWRCYGNPAYPAEWDGKVYGGGKLSQRFWEYHETIGLLELTPDSVVLDIGGGSPITGAGFFTRVIAPHVKQVHVMDVNFAEFKDVASNIVMHRSLANYETLSKVLKEQPQITHVACISVFEHIPADIRCGMVRAVNECFRGDIFVSTLEFHSNESYFEHQLVTQTLSEMFAELTAFYPDTIHKSPFWCQNAFEPAGIGSRILKNRRFTKGKTVEIPLWYPVAFRFRRDCNFSPTVPGTRS